MRKLCESGDRAHYPQPTTYLISIKDLWKMGKIFFSNGTDNEWDNETKEYDNKYNSKIITSDYLSVSYVVSEMVKSIA